MRNLVDLIEKIVTQLKALYELVEKVLNRERTVVDNALKTTSTQEGRYILQERQYLLDFRLATGIQTENRHLADAIKRSCDDSGGKVSFQQYRQANRFHLLACESEKLLVKIDRWDVFYHRFNKAISFMAFVMVMVLAIIGLLALDGSTGKVSLELVALILSPFIAIVYAQIQTRPLKAAQTIRDCSLRESEVGNRLF